MIKSLKLEDFRADDSIGLAVVSFRPEIMPQNIEVFFFELFE